MTNDIRWHFCKDGDLPHVERPTDEGHIVPNMETCLVSYHFTSSPSIKEQDVFIFAAFRDGEPEWRHNDRWCSPIAESIIVDAWISLDEVYKHLWKQQNDGIEQGGIDMKTLRCANPECQREIQYGESLYVLPYRDPVYCSTYCFARHMGLYELIKDDPETDEYDLWWEEENDGTEQ